MEIKKIGLIGYGEVGQALAKGLSTTDDLFLHIFDTRYSDRSSNFLNNFSKKALFLEEDLESLVQKSELIISAVTGDNALEVARESAEHTKKGKIFVDMTTVAPQVKIEMQKLIEDRQASFIEVAILGTIASYGYKSPMLVCGKEARDFADLFNQMGFKVNFVSVEIGKASTMKMLRSVFSKGVESLLFEMLIAAEKCDLLESMMEAVSSHMDKSSFHDIAETWITTNVIHAKRRTEEMDHVINTLNELEVEPVMTTATRERLRRCAELNLYSHYKQIPLSSYRDVIKSMVKFNYS